MTDSEWLQWVKIYANSLSHAGLPQAGLLKTHAA